MTNPTVVVLSSREGLPVAQRLMQAFDRNWERAGLPSCTIKYWDDCFPAGQSFLESLRVMRADFAIVLFTRDDFAVVRGNSMVVPRDNLVFELGLFTARLPPGHTILVTEEAIKVPSDYAGISAITYTRPTTEELRALENPLARAGMKLMDDVRVKWQESHSVPPPPRSLAATDYTITGTDGLVVPVYRDVHATDDWFAALRQALLTGEPRLDSKMLYFGPGLANGWVDLSQEFSAHQDLLRTFEGHIVPLLGTVKIRSQLTLVDLGVGDLSRGKQVIDHYLVNPALDRGKLDYVAVDISYDMLKLAFQAEGKILKAIQRVGGKVRAINTEFANLHRYGRLFGEEGSNLFLLLGNTIGNESNEISTLRNIAAAMGTGDRLVVEYQAIEEAPFSGEELSQRLQKHKAFYTAPFTALNCAPSNVEFLVLKDDYEAPRRGIAATAYKFICRFPRDVDLYHYGFGEPIRMPQGDVCVYIVRKYEKGAMTRLLERCGFSVEEDKIYSSPPRPNEEPTAQQRRFGYAVAVKKAKESQAARGEATG